MAKRITSEDLVLNLILDADKVDQGSKKLLGALHKLDRETRDLQNELSRLQIKMKNLDKNSADYSNEVKQLQDRMKKLRAEISANHAKMNEWRRQIGLSGLTINQLRSHLSALRVQLHNATDPTVLKNLRRQIKLTQDRMERMTTGMTRMAQAWRRMGTFANQFGTLSAWLTIAIFGVARAVNSTTKNMRQLDKQFSSVMKTTDLTRNEVAKLKKEFDQLNEDEGIRTPTSTKNLLEIARIAGRLGIRGVEDIRNFTMAVDKLYVALGDDLEGSVEEITEQVGKLVNVFGLAKEGGMDQSEALLRVGSVLNELGKSSEANAQNILNFTSRMGGVGSMADFTIDQLAGLAATLDATGVKAERGSTAVVKLITGLGEHADKFSRILGITKKDYVDWIHSDVNGVLLAMLDATGKNSESILEVVNSMGDMEVSGVRVAETFGKLSQNTEMLREQQLIAARAFESSASVMNEYYIITKDWDSLMALQGKRLKSLADDYSKSMTPAMYKLYRGFIDFLYALKDVAVWIGNNTGLIWGLTAAWTAFRSARIVRVISELIISTRLWAGDLWRATAASWANNAAVKAMTASYITAGGGVKGLTAALRALWGVMLANPFTAIIAIAGAAAGAFFLFRKRTDEVKAAMSDMNVEMATQRNAMQKLFEAAKRSGEGTAQRAEAIKTINKVYGEYLTNLLSEKAGQEELTTAYEEANQKLSEQIALKFKNERYDKLIEKGARERVKKQERMLGGVKTRDGAFAYGQAMFETDQVLERLAKMTDPTARSLVITQFLDKWELNNQASRKAFLELIELRKDELEMERQLDESIKGYISGGTAGTGVKGGTGPDASGTVLTDEQFETAKAEAEMLRDEQRLALMQMGLDKEEYRKRELKAEEEFLRKVLELTQQRYTTEKGALIGGDKDILDAQIALQQNLMAQQKDGGKKRTAKTKEELLDTEVLLLEMLDNRKITQSQFDLLMLQMQEDYYAQMIAKGRAGGEDVLEWEKKWYENRIKQRAEFEKQQSTLSKAMTFALNPEPEETVAEDDNLVKNLIKERDRVRQFLGLETGVKEDLEPDFAAFEIGNYAEQVKILEKWYELDWINKTEFERRKTDVVREQNNMRLKYTSDVMGAINDLLGAQGQLFAAQKDAELKKAGDNEAKKLAIQKKYAKKEQSIATAQAAISGALAIMRIWEAKALADPVTDAIIKGILTAAMVVTTGTQIAAIKAQQFAKGRYPVVGADDGKTYDAEFVGRPETGIYKKPSLGLFAEKPEMVIDYPTLRNIQMNSPALIEAILAQRGRGRKSEVGSRKTEERGVRQFADGSYPVGDASNYAAMVAEVKESNKQTVEAIKQIQITVAVETIEREMRKYAKIQQTKGL
jgi:TP901 family phage tail tape measure protein